MAEGARVYDATRTPLEAFQQELKNLNDLMQGGAITANTYQRAVTQLQDSFLDADETSRAFTSIFSSVIQAIGNGEDAMEAFRKTAIRALTNIADEILKMAVLQPIMRSLFGSFTGGPSLGGGIWPAAKGNAYSDGSIIPFANGGIVNRPTLFPMANGAGLMGEAGPEAILPLRRGAGGKLGVAASGTGGKTTVVVNNYSGAPTETRESTGPDGSEMIEVMVGTVDRGLKEGRFNRSMSSQFGSRPVMTRR